MLHSCPWCAHDNSRARHFRPVLCWPVRSESSDLILAPEPGLHTSSCTRHHRAHVRAMQQLGSPGA